MHQLQPGATKDGVCSLATGQLAFASLLGAHPRRTVCVALFLLKYIHILNVQCSA